ncbi:SCO family protein [Massilia sp. CMS3.1]|uniref:SCO family protein n=1 Tax=Massilia sp. CMS3.1 TaxID=3373083 RepID=UPI003EE66EE7
MNARRGFIAAGIGGAVLPAISGSSARAAAGARVDDFPNPLLLTHEGQRVRFYDDVVKGNKALLFNMMYASCRNICPPNTANLLQMHRLLGDRMGKDIHFYSLTLQPEIDRPRDLQAYVRRFRIGAGWTFLTGTRRDIDEIRRKLGFFDPDPAVDADLAQHGGMVRIGNQALDRWSMMPSLMPPARLARTVADLAR